VRNQSGASISPEPDKHRPDKKNTCPPKKRKRTTTIRFGSGRRRRIFRPRVIESVRGAALTDPSPYRSRIWLQLIKRKRRRCRRVKIARLPLCFIPPLCDEGFARGAARVWFWPFHVYLCEFAWKFALTLFHLLHHVQCLRCGSLTDAIFFSVHFCKFENFTKTFLAPRQIQKKSVCRTGTTGLKTSMAYIL
jgi:hypothetical protein